MTKMVLFIATVLTLPAYALDIEPIRLTTYKTHSRLTILIDRSIPVKWIKNRKGFELEIQGITLNDLGVPSGDEAHWKKIWSKFHDSRLSTFHVLENTHGVVVSGTWGFPTGKYEFADPDMMVFDYRDSQRSQWVLDFWPKPGPTLVQKREDEKKAQVQAFLKRIEQEGKKRVARALASVKRSDDEWMRKTVCQQPLNEQTEVFIQFLPTHQKFDFSPWFSATRADDGFVYLKPSSDSTENQYVRLAIKFYEAGKTALALRTIEFFKNEFPHSPLLQEMMFLQANALIKLGLTSQGEHALAQLTVDAKSKPIGFYSTKYVTQKLLNSHSTLAALQNFLSLIRDYPNHEEIWLFHLGAAEMLYLLGETDRAVKEYQWVIDKAPQEELKAEAAFRVGDLYLAHHQYEHALVSYHHASEYFKDYQSRFPSYFLNKAEVYHQLGHLDQSQKLFEEFLRRFPTHSSGWKATLRLAEIVARDPEGRGQEDPRYRSWLYETINRYPFSPGVPLARIGLLPCGDHGGFDHKTAIEYLTDENALKISSAELSLKNYSEVKAISRVRSLIFFSDADQPIDVALHEYQLAQNPSVKKTLAVLTQVAFRRRIQDLMSRKEKLKALSYYAKYFSKLPKAYENQDVDYLVQLSESALELGLPRLASELVEQYHQHMSKDRLPASAQLGETPESIQELMRRSEENFAQAKSKWVSIRDKIPNLADYTEIRKYLSRLGDDSEFSYEKEIILGLMAEKQEQVREALKHVQRAQLLKASFLIDSWLASLELKIGNETVALAIYENLEKRLLTQKSLRQSSLKIESKSNVETQSQVQSQNNGEKVEQSQANVSLAENLNHSEAGKLGEFSDQDGYSERLLGVQAVESLDQLYLVQGAILEGQKNWESARLIYQKAIQAGLQGNQLKFKLARCLYKLGGTSNRALSQEMFKKISESNSEEVQEKFWKSLALEVLNNQAQVDSLLNKAKEGKL